MTDSGNLRTAVAIIGSGNIGTDLLIKIQRQSAWLEAGAFAGIDAASEGLRRAQRLVNGDAHLDAPNVNMVTCGGQAPVRVDRETLSLGMPVFIPAFCGMRKEPPRTMASTHARSCSNSGAARWSGVRST